MKTLSFTVAFFMSLVTLAQTADTPLDTTRGLSEINYSKINNTVQFSPKAPQLIQTAGAPKAFYTHFWEFGDGEYSNEELPKHTYKNAKEYDVRLWTTNMYSSGKPPTARPKKIRIDTATDSSTDNSSATLDTSLDLVRNREPMPEEDIVVVMRYKNTKDYETNGTLYLYYNETAFTADNFEVLDARFYNNEEDVSDTELVMVNSITTNDYFYASHTQEPLEFKTIAQDSTEKLNLPLTLAESETKYRASKTIAFKNMKPNEERNLFYTLKTTPEMIKDTSAIVTIRGVYVPDDNYQNHKVKEMEMEIVTSHDPNKMSSNATFLNYRLVRYKTPKFKIKFQNNGEGPATTIRLETDIPEMLDKSSITVEDMYPKCKICPKEEVQYSCLDTTYTATQAIFTFKNIYLPGSEQKNVKDYDSTKGFVKYNIKFSDDFHKKKTKSRTAIIFDKNDPIITNYSTTRFLPGISIGAKAGYNSFSDLKNSKSYFIGATVSPYKSYRWYWQVELLNSFHSYNGTKTIREEFVDSPAGFIALERTTKESSYDNIDWEIPVLARYNVNNYIGLGAGLQGTFSVSQQKTERITIQQYEGEQTDSNLLINQSVTESDTKNNFANFRTGFLIEATAGFARIGPTAGVRYVFNFKDAYDYLQFYALWKF
ncbi:PKD domain-containing protein [Bizionia saleffrena]|uniref:PKD domain-containing protein n=1 Tax=Bizionia saleffrena TaxID=291189 RepID=A0A8H2LFM0_9FLAO|nr:PKD domain-containing protein [Bizionia saleffrena]TYB76104.1 PKD domain-containing protein [Bizionia saleffrena]